MPAIYDIYRMIDGRWQTTDVYEALEDAVTDYGVENVRLVARGVWTLHDCAEIVGILVKCTVAD